MQRFTGPDFDNRLIQLVRENPAIYDVSHPHYRRNPVRVAIWDRIAAQLGAPSRFLQTKWKNIRYNYLQEVKSMETGICNPNLRKRRFTEDLSFLQFTAQTYNVKMYKKMGVNSTSNSSDNDNESNSYIYPDNHTSNSFGVIEIEHSDEEVGHKFYPHSYDNGNVEDLQNDIKVNQMDFPPAAEDNAYTLELNFPAQEFHKEMKNELNPDISEPSSPLLTPLVVMGNGDENQQKNGNVITEPAPKKKNPIRIRPPREILDNMAKRKSMPAPFPVLTPINDPIELYCLSLVDTLRNMPRSERERVKFEFAKILKDAKYKDQS